MLYEADRRFRAVHAAGSSASGSQGASPRVPSPPGAVTTTDTNGVAGTGSNDSTTNGKSDGIVYYDCVVCGRSVSSPIALSSYLDSGFALMYVLRLVQAAMRYI